MMDAATRLSIQFVLAEARKYRNSKGNKWTLYNTLKMRIELLNLSSREYSDVIRQLAKELNI